MAKGQIAVLAYERSDLPRDVIVVHMEFLIAPLADSA